MSEALEVARDLVDRGVPVFACPPGDGPKGYRLPTAWQSTRADPRRLNVYRPGYALAAVCGHVYDVIDRDPRNDPGDLPCAWPEVYGIASTPGGGEHYWIAATGLPKAKIAQGWDLQAGTAAGGRGFVFIPGTPGYGWLDEPRWARQGDATADGLSGWLAASKPASGHAAAREDGPVAVGGRDADATAYAASLRRRGFTESEAATAMAERWRLYDQPTGDVFPLDAALAKLESAWRKFEPRLEPIEAVGFSRPSNVVALRPGDGPPTLEPAAPRITVLDSNDLEAIRPPTPLLAGLLDVDTVAVLSGKFGSYKTFVSLAWAASLATGVPWGPFGVPEARPVVYVAAEGASGVRDRLAAWRSAHGEIPRGMLRVVPHAVLLDRAADVDELIALAQGAGLIVLDTLHKMSPGAEEQSSKDMGLVLSFADRIRRETGAAILFDHHTGHAGERARGSSAIEDDVDMSWVIQMDDEERRTAIRTLVHRKVKDGELQESRKLIFNAAVNSGYVTPGPLENRLTKNARALHAIWVALDAANVQPGTARRPAAALLRGRGLQFVDADLGAVLEHRRLEADGRTFYQRPDWAPRADLDRPATTAGPNGWTLPGSVEGPG